MKKKLKIVLKQDVENLGSFGQIKEVAAGYARNFLIPRGLALYLKDPASKQILKTVEEKRKKEEIETEKLKEIAQKLQGAMVTIKAKVGEKGKLFGSIGSKEIVEKINQEYKIKLDKKHLELAPIKEIGESEVLIKLGYGIGVKLKIKIEAEEGKEKTKKPREAM